MRAAIGGCKDLQPGHRMKKFAKIDVGISVWQKSKVIAHKPSRCSTRSQTFAVFNSGISGNLVEQRNLFAEVFDKVVATARSIFFFVAAEQQQSQLLSVAHQRTAPELCSVH